MPKLEDFDFQSGKVLLFDKPYTWTSFDVVNKVRSTIQKYFTKKRIKVGHAGTLDPLATGLLILGVGKATKKLRHYQELPKTYTGTMRFGATTPSYDRETEIDRTFENTPIPDEKLRQATKLFTGEIKQTPPSYSAVKVKGKRAYKAARKKKKINVPERQVTVERFNINEVSWPEVRFVIQCSKGTYIRSIVHDFGKMLNNGAYLSELRRTKIGSYDVDDAWQINVFTQLLKQKYHENTP